MDYFRVTENLDVINGQDGWELVEMDWDPRDGMSCFQYERTIKDKGVELAIVWRPQPVTFVHRGWWDRDKTERVLEMTDCDWSRYERGLYNDPVEVPDDYAW